ncbi:hypothetical protein ABIA69_001884 [Lysinibacillus parviboronicapiens]|uniref:Aconitate hydratase n=1 Tax=Lysinibacillus parviboronicapiens TaxID=436516 RepID=A0ABV2PIK4_9BACI
MITGEQRKLLHEFVILDLAIQSLQRDYEVIENLKMSKVYLPILDGYLKAIRNDYFNLKRVLASQKITIVKWEKVSEYFSDLTVTSTGNDDVFRYANQALKTQVEELLISKQNK